VVPISDQRNSYLWGVDEQVLDNESLLTPLVEEAAELIELGVERSIGHNFGDRSAGDHGATSAVILRASDIVASSYTEAGRHLHVHSTTCRGISLEPLHNILKEIFKPELIITSREPIDGVQQILKLIAGKRHPSGLITLGLPVDFQIN
jgi:S-adenosylmethionine/arginine decarboxylase-like enzyme